MVPILYTDDIRGTLKFYLDHFEMRIVSAVYADKPYEFESEPDPADASRTMNMFLLRSTANDKVFYHDFAATQEDVGKELRRTPGSSAQFYVRVADARSLYEKLKGAGEVEIICKPFISWQGGKFKEFSVRDCNGYLVSFTQDLAPAEKAKGGV